MKTIHSKVFILFCCNVICVNSEVNSKFDVEYQWNYINFTWNTKADLDKALLTETYIPANVAMAGIKNFNNKFYIALPRIRKGVPVTLGTISSSSPKQDPLITPFPNWEMNKLNDCSHLQSVQSMEIDKNGTMWVLDGLRINNFTQCPPKLVLFDLNDDARVVHCYEFPEQVSLSSGGFLNDVVIDETGGNYAYITDNSPIDPGLIVFSLRKNRAWKLRDSSMFPDVNVSSFVVDGEEFQDLAPVDGIALSPIFPNKTRTLFYCTLADVNLYSISTDILKNEQILRESAWRRDVKLVGKKQAPSDGMVTDNKGNLYYGLLPLYAVGVWNIHEPFSNARILDQNRETMTWTDSFAFDSNRNLYVLANNIHKFFNPNFKLQITDGVKFRILKLFTSHKSYLYQF